MSVGVGFRVYGAITELAHMYDPRILVEGPANTGKSSGILRLFESRAWACPDIRVLLLRQTMQSLRESTLATLEDKVWAPMMQGQRHPAMHGTALRANRRTYNYPNGVVYVVGGLEDPGWTFSMEYDLIAGFEAWEFSRDAIEKLYRANRNHVLCRYAPWNRALATLCGAHWHIPDEWGRPMGANWLDDRWMEWHGNSRADRLDDMPREVRQCIIDRSRPGGFGCWQQIILDTNPAGEFHLLNQMAAPLSGEVDAQMRDDREVSSRVFRSANVEQYPFTRLLSRHEDNPACTDDDLERLRSMTGARRANLYLGLWQSAEGQVWPGYNPSVHLISFAIERRGEPDPDAKTDKRELWIRFLGDRNEEWFPEPDLQIKWVFMSQDLGWRNAACLQVWGVDYQDRIFLLAEVHRRRMMDDWWTDRVMEFWMEFDSYAAVLDCEDPERVVKINDRLEKKKARAIAVGVDKSVRRGNRTKFVPTTLDLVRELLDPEQKGGPRIFFGRDTLRHGRCPISVEMRQPTCTTEEIGGFVFPIHKDGQADSEEPDKAIPQDGCAALRYAAVYKWLMDPKGKRKTPRFPVGTIGHRMGHESVLQRSKGWVPE